MQHIISFFGKISRYLISIICMVDLLFIFPSYGQVSNFRLYSNIDIEKSTIYIEGNAYQKDFLLFTDMLKKCHPAFAVESNYMCNIDSIQQDGYNWAGGCQSIKNLWIYMQGITTLLNDGHTTLLPEINMEVIYPVAFFFDHDNIYITGINEEYKSFLGKQIELINGYSINHILNHFKQIISSDNEIHFISQVTDFLQLYSFWDYTPYCLSDSTLQLTFTDDTNVSILPIGKSKLDIVWHTPQVKQHETIRKNNRTPFHYTILPERDLCYFQFNSCIDKSTLRLHYLQSNPNISEKELAEKTSIYPRFDTFLNKMFSDIRKNEIGTIVIDVRNNKGGNSKLCDVLLSWLKPVKTIKTFNSHTRFSNLWKQSYPTLAEDFEQAFLKIQQPFEMGNLYDNIFLSSLPGLESENIYTENFIMNYDESLIFRGKIIFIQNERTYSSSGLLITQAIDNNIGFVIGDKSSYKPCHYGDLLMWELPNTKIKGYVSHKIFNRPNTDKCNENYLFPSVYLSPTWYDISEGKDICWEWILENHIKAN